MSPNSNRQSFRNEDLVLKVSSSVDPAVWDESKYEAFIDELCGFREFQKDAIRTTMRYLAGGRYPNLKALARENFDANDELQRRYGSWRGMASHLQLPEQLSCSLDMATGTGKSYVIYGLAAILLAEGLIDRALVLCPSNTIEIGLLEKFRSLAGNADLRDLLPSNAKIKNPRIINASETIVDGAICVENYHAILAHVKSSIRDSLLGCGVRVAVFNDEAHHVANQSTAKVKKWKEFLLNPEYGFRYIVGLSGTCYVKDDYFADVVSRYSLRQAMEERVIKKIEYVAEMPRTDDPDEKWQLCYQRHRYWAKHLKSRNIRPLTIIVTRDIKTCDIVAGDLRDFLVEREEITPEKAADKVIPVSSSPAHQVNIARLRSVDSPASSVEWIVSVSMLSEGWDVKNVFQIVPHEERAFNSKLLIAQVLGRGLRRPIGWQGADPIVTVFNHDAWANRIRNLVNEVLENELRLSSVILEDSPYNFDLHNLNYDRITDEEQHFPRNGECRLLENGYVKLPTQVEIEKVVIEFETAVAETPSRFQTELRHKTYSFEEIANDLYRRLRAIDDESREAPDSANRTNYTATFTHSRCLEIIKETGIRAGITSGLITEQNRQRILGNIGPLGRKGTKRVVYRLNPNMLVSLSTRSRQAISVSASDLRCGKRSLFITPETEATIPDEALGFFQAVNDPDGEYRAGYVSNDNIHDFKTPCNCAIADGNPERTFIRRLCERENATAIDAWLKNAPQNFYSFEYAWKKGTKPKRGQFSPDFFIKRGNRIYVVEIKDDGEIADPSPENRKKAEYALAHFERLNEWLVREDSAISYQFNFLSPSSFNTFFIKLRAGEADGFCSELDVTLAQTD
jgi:type III restriction enzyme